MLASMIRFATGGITYNCFDFISSTTKIVPYVVSAFLMTLSRYRQCTLLHRISTTTIINDIDFDTPTFNERASNHWTLHRQSLLLHPFFVNPIRVFINPICVFIDPIRSFIEPILQMHTFLSWLTLSIDPILGCTFI